MSVRSKLLASCGGAPTDTYFKNVTLLLHGDGSNGAQNNTFLDSSTNNFTITRNGNTTQGSFSPYGSVWSNYFDGNGDYIYGPNNTAVDVWDSGSNSFTVEAWIFATASIPNNCSIVGKAELNGSPGWTAGWALQSYNGYLNVNTAGDTRLFNSNTTAIPLNQWVHCVLVKNGSTVSLFQNGTRVASISNSSSYSNTSDQIHIGTDRAPGGSKFTGYISDIRMVKGTSVYNPSSSTITVPTAPLTAITNTSLLTCQSNRFRDASTNNFTITPNGDVKVTNFAPFAPSAAYSTGANGGSAYFDGSGDYLTTTNVNFTGDATVECWLYVSSFSSNFQLFGTNAGASDGKWLGIIVVTDGSMVGAYAAGAAAGWSAPAGTIKAGQWMHVAWVKNGSTVYVYVNGTQVASGTASASYAYNAGSPFVISRLDGNNSLCLNGYISNFRVVNGTAVYTSAFTPPTSPVTAITNTSLLLNATNAAIYDNSMKNDLETVGNAQISTSVKKFGTGSMYFDGSGDYLTIPANPDNRINTTGDFTIEFWAYFSSVASNQRLLAWDNDANNFVIALYTDTSGHLAYYLSSTGTSWNIAVSQNVGNISTGTWCHIALVRNGNTFTPYLNGTAGTSTTSSSALYSSTLPFAIGATGTGTSPFNGYIDDFRITKGVARYTANFTPPTAAFANQ